MRRYAKALSRTLYGGGTSNPTAHYGSHWWSGQLESWGELVQPMSWIFCHITQDKCDIFLPETRHHKLCPASVECQFAVSHDTWRLFPLTPSKTQRITKRATHSWGPALFGDERKMERVEAEGLLILNPFLSSKDFKVYSSWHFVLPLGTGRNWPARPG